MVTYPNQNIVLIGAKPLMDANNPYARISVEALQKAMTTLKPAGLKMWLYLAKNESGYEFGLGPKACEAFGIKKDSYYKSLDELKEHGYLFENESGRLEFRQEPVLRVKKEVEEREWDF